MSNHDIYERLKADILDLRFRPGTVLQEQQVGQLYGASRTPAREALRALLSVGLVVKYGKFYVVRSFSGTEVRHLYEIRVALEALSVRLAIRHAADEDLFALREHMVRHTASVRQAPGATQTTDSSVFHLKLAELSGNPLLLAQLREIHDKVIFLSHLADTCHREEFIDSLDDHMRVVDAMIRRNEAIAVAELEAHIRWGADIYARYFEERAAADIAAAIPKVIPASA